MPPLLFKLNYYRYYIQNTRINVLLSNNRTIFNHICYFIFFRKRKNLNLIFNIILTNFDIYIQPIFYCEIEKEYFRMILSPSDLNNVGIVYV